MIKLIAVDLDDTLLNKDIEISKRNFDTIKKCQEKGINFTIATGRMYKSAVKFAKSLDVKLPIITYQGAMVKDVGGKEFYHQPIEKKLAIEVIDYLRKHDLQLNVYLNDELYAEKVDEYGEEYKRISKVDLNIARFPQDINTDPTKILLIGEAKKLDVIQEDMVKLYGDELALAKSKECFLEIGHKECNKGVALKQLAKTLGVEREEVLAIGDGMNDYDMIEYAGIGVAVENADEKLKRIADFITDTNDNDGVAKAIEKFTL